MSRTPTPAGLLFRPWPIRRRLVLALAAIAAILALVSWSMVTGFAREAASRTQDNVLTAAVTSIAETLRSEGGAIRLDLPYSAFSMLGALSEDRVFYRVVAGAEVLTGYADLPGPIPQARGAAFATMTYRGETVRVVSLRRVILSDGRAVPVTVTLAQSQIGVDTIVAGLSRQAALWSVAVFLVSIGLFAITVRAALRPLNTIAQSVANRGPSDLRPLRRPAPAEMAPLIAALNRLMERLGAQVRRSEDFIAEAAHRVRTPLAIVRTQADLALHAADAPDQHRTLRQVIRAVDDASRSAGQLLDHAMVAFRADDLARTEIDLPELVRGVVDALRPTAEMKDIDITTEASTATIHGDPILIQNALRNILDNAVKYSATDSAVHVALSQQDGQARIAVTDSGPGFGPGEAESLTERFRRGARTEGIVGSGLGLTIAKEAVAAHGGQLEFHGNSGKKEGAGACVTMVLPQG